MTREILIFLTLIWSAPVPAAAPVDREVLVGTFAPGVSLGLQSAGALSLKYWFKERLALDVNVEYLGRPFTVFYADVHYHFPKLLAKSPRRLHESVIYVGAGIGAGAWFREETCVRFGCTWPVGNTGSGDGYFLRFLGGIEWYAPKTRLGIFTELTPSYLLYPNTKFAFDLVFGLRYYL